MESSHPSHFAGSTISRSTQRVGGLVHTLSNSFHHRIFNARPWRHRKVHLACFDRSSHVQLHSTFHCESKVMKSSPSITIDASSVSQCSNAKLLTPDLNPTEFNVFSPLTFPRITRAVHGSLQPPDNIRWFVCFGWRFDI